MEKISRYLPITVIIIVIIIISVKRRDKRNNEKEEKQRIEAVEQRRIDSIKSGLYDKYSIEYDWVQELYGEEDYRFENIKTIELQKLWVENGNVFFDTYIKDLAKLSDDKYTIEFGMSRQSNTLLLLKDEFEIHASLDYEYYDSINIHFPGIFHEDFSEYDQRIFVVVDIDTIAKERILDEEGNYENLWHGTGKLLEFVPITSD